MKPIKKCSLCGKDVKYIARHIRFEHTDISIQKYYDIFLKRPEEGNANYVTNLQYLKI